MRKNRSIQTNRPFKIRALLCALLAVVFIISCSVTITLQYKGIYRRDLRNLHIAEENRMTEAQVMKNYDVLISYLSIGGSKTLQFSDFSMSESGRAHFQEVRRIFLGGTECFCTADPDAGHYHSKTGFFVAEICRYHYDWTALLSGNCVYCGMGSNLHSFSSSGVSQ